MRPKEAVTGQTGCQPLLYSYADTEMHYPQAEPTMTEKPKRTKTKPTWTDVKGKIGEFDRAGLTQLIADHYAFQKDNQSFLHARFSLGPSPLDDYKMRMAAALAPDVYRKRNADVSVATAKKAISDYNKAVGDPLGVLELRLFFCEVAVNFSMDFGYADVGYLDAMANQYRDACKTLSALDDPILSDTIERLENIRDDAQMGCGIGDYMGDELGAALIKLPPSKVEAVVPQLDEM